MIKEKIIAFVLDKPKLSLILSSLCCVFLLPFLLHIKADFSYRGFYHPENEHVKEFDSFVQEFSGDDTAAMVLKFRDSIFTEKNIELIKELTEKIWEIPGVLKVTSITNYVEIAADGEDLLIEEFLTDSPLDEVTLIRKLKTAQNDRILPGYLIGNEPNLTPILVRLKPQISGTPKLAETLRQLEAMLEDIDSKLVSRTYLVGSPIVSKTFKKISQQDLMITIPICVLVVIFVIFLLYKRVLPITLTFAVINLSILTTFAAAGAIGIKYNNIISAIPILLLAISIADCIHLFSVFVREEQRTKNIKESLEKTLKHIFLPTLLTTLSTAIGFISLSFSEIMPVKGLGILGAVGVVSAWLFTIYFVAPAILIFWKYKKVDSKTEGRLDLNLFVQSIQRNRLKIIALFTLVTAALGIIGLSNTVDSDPLTYMKGDNPFKIGTLLVENEIGGVQGIEVVLDSGTPEGIFRPDFIKKVQKFATWLENRNEYTKVLSYLDTIKRISQAVNFGKEDFYQTSDTREINAQYFMLYEMGLPPGNSITDQVNLDRSKARVRGLWVLHNSKTILEEFEAVEAKLKELNLKGKVSGKMPIFHHMNSYVVNTFVVSMASAVLLIAVLMIIIFKSVKLGLVSLIPNIFPLILGSGVLVILGKNLDMGSVVVGAICIGIAIDDTIHFLSGYFENKKKFESNEEAITETLNSTGRALVSTTLILVAGFSTFLLSKFTPNFNLGLMTSIILMLALLLDLLLLPALLLKNKKASP